MGYYLNTERTVEKISTPLAHVFNMSLQEEIVPLESKESGIRNILLSPMAGNI